MRNISLVISFIAILIITTSFVTDNRISEKNTKKETVLQDDSELYWFYIRMRIDVRKKKYSLIGTASRIERGNQAKFEKKLWWGLAKKQIAIGPFLNLTEAENARLKYRASRKRIIAADESSVTEVHWFLLSIKPRKRAGAYKLVRMPARTATGTPEQFIDALHEGLSFEHLTVGPFWDYNQAELSKTLYRKNE